MQTSIIDDDFVHDSNYKRIYIKQNMNYKEKYEKTLERARKELQVCGSTDCDAARQILRFFPELKESENEKIKKELITYFKNLSDVYSLEPLEINPKKAIAWLEKQGEQKPTDKIQLGKKYKCIASPRYSAFMKGEIYKPEDKFLCSLMNFCYDCFEPIEDGEQKVEQKFHEGDWIVSPNGVYWHIDKISNNRYEVTSNTGESSNWNLDTNIYHKFNIQDAKDGDVLIIKEGKRPFIFKGLLDKHHPECPVVYCGIDIEYKFFVPYGIAWWTDEEVCPATKEQCDILMKAMANAGYTFDFDKKELKKIEEEINGKDYGIDSLYHAQRILEKTLGEVDGYQSDDGILEHKAAITAIKNLYEQKPVEWGEYDKTILTNIIIMLKEGASHHFIKDDITKAVDWLKSLIPQNTWKPSDEQLEALESATENCAYSEYQDCLRGLIEQLKKLKE